MRRLWLAAMLAVLGLSSAAVRADPAQTPPAPPRIELPEPIWDRAPRYDDLAKLYPPKALAAGISGHVTMRCRVTRHGALEGCAVISETPRGYGFGEASLATPKFFRLAPRLLNGQPQRDRDIPLIWRLPPK
jgi:protein TonB